MNLLHSRGTRSRMSIALAALLLFAFGCAQPNEREATPTDAALPTDHEDDIVDGKALVQILVYGLLAFEPDHPTTPTVIKALFPPDPHHEPRIQHGKYKGGGDYDWAPLFMWNDFKQDDEIRIVFDPPLLRSLNVPVFAGAIGTYPASSTEARDARWMLQEKEIDGAGHAADASKAYITARIDHGDFETCGLVYDDTKSWEVCRVEAGDADRAMSEYMVLRVEIPSSTKVEVLLGREVSSPKKVVPATGDHVAGYTAVYDISITNLNWLENTRLATSAHGDILRRVLFPTASAWSDFSYDPALCVPNRQPPCLDRYKSWKYGSGYDRPLCPFVGG